MPNQIQVKGRSPEEIMAAEKKKADEEKEAGKKKPIKQEPKHFDIKLECMVPCTVTYRILAMDEHDALIQMDKRPPTGVKPNLSKKKNIKATIYDSGSSIIRFMKSFRV